MPKQVIILNGASPSSGEVIVDRVPLPYVIMITGGFTVATAKVEESPAPDVAYMNSFGEVGGSGATELLIKELVSLANNTICVITHPTYRLKVSLGAGGSGTIDAFLITSL